MFVIPTPKTTCEQLRSALRRKYSYASMQLSRARVFLLLLASLSLSKSFKVVSVISARSIKVHDKVTFVARPPSPPAAVLLWCCRSHSFLWEQANAAQFGGIGYRPLTNLPDGTMDLRAVRLYCNLSRHC